MNKRWEIFNELIYYLFDSLLIPLIRSNFHVTESNVHRYRLFFFRHDVWKSIAEPALASLKLSMFEEIQFERARRILASRTLGFSQVRLLPKESGVRPIVNLRRRAIKKGSSFLGSSINSILAPVYNVLTYEKASFLSRSNYPADHIDIQSCSPRKHAFLRWRSLLTPQDVQIDPGHLRDLLLC